jgi:hypothetical protein
VQGRDCFVSTALTKTCELHRVVYGLALVCTWQHLLIHTQPVHQVYLSLLGLICNHCLHVVSPWGSHCWHCVCPVTQFKSVVQLWGDLEPSEGTMDDLPYVGAESEVAFFTGAEQRA